MSAKTDSQTWRLVTAWVVATLILFCGLAIFSPLHQHNLNHPGQCSLNHFDDVLICGAIVGLITLLMALATLERVSTVRPATISVVFLPRVGGRAPPFFL
jgi:hypothetical protein